MSYLYRSAGSSVPHGRMAGATGESSTSGDPTSSRNESIGQRGGAPTVRTQQSAGSFSSCQVRDWDLVAPASPPPGPPLELP